MRPYIQIARPDHWFKNIFVLPGTAIALLLYRIPLSDVALPLIFGLISTCLAASANYTINEYLDADFDRHHPTKMNRPTPSGLVKFEYVMFQYVFLTVAALSIAWFLGTFFFITCTGFLSLGLAYNVSPIRTKDRVFFDVISESANNPIRLVLGWSVVVDYAFPPTSVLMAFWFGGAFLMAVKRFAEFRQIGDPVVATKYRQSFGRYSETTLLLSAVFYAMNTAFFIAIFLIKYRIEFLISFPLISLMFTWYLALGLQPDSVTQTPELLYRKKHFLAFIGLLIASLVFLFLIEIPALHVLMNVTGL
ncbi:MAG: Protoheme IX farnesyltransferase [Alphaproteobacteria bacterium MarineAlpha4_Bin2]|nr:MAG: Protoheme IX farnesyltransferase [Alphaproteobacteria bacterium MarineAlpha4_Bin2]